jgi:hypothetical protein
MDFEFETTRTSLANAFAGAGAELLAYQPLVSTAVAMIPGASPQKYAIAGTLPGILQMAGKMMGEEGNTGLEGLTRYYPECRGQMRASFAGDYVKFSDVERLLAARAAAEKPTGDLPDEQIYALWKQAIDQFQKHEYGKSVHPSIYLARAIARAAIAAHLARQAQASDKHLPGWERGIATVTLTGHQLRAALDFLNPDGDDDPDQRDESLTFGIVQHKDDDSTASTGMCCWNDDTDGVLPLDGEYTAAPSSQEGAHAARNEVLEEAANALDLMNDSAGDRAAHEQREMLCCENERMWTLIHAAKAIRALQTPACAERSGE